MALSATDSDFAIVIGIKQILINVLLSNIMFYFKKKWDLIKKEWDFIT